MRSCVCVGVSTKGIVPTPFPHAGLPPTEEQRRSFEALQTQIAGHLKFKSYSMAEYDLTDLLRKISQTWQKPLARERGAAEAGQPAGPSLVM